MYKKVDIQFITGDTLEFARKLRNANRKQFFTTKVISKEDQNKWFESLKDSDLEFYVIYYYDQPCGTISVFPMPDRLVIGNVCIAKQFRGNGIFKATLKILKKIYTVKTWEVSVRADNPGAEEAYFSLGFGLTQLIMVKNL